MAKKTTGHSHSTKGHAKGVSTGEVLLDAGMDVARKIGVQSLVLYVDGLENLSALETLDFAGNDPMIILIARSQDAYDVAQKFTDKVVRLPEVDLTRTGQIKMAAMMGFSKRQLHLGDRLVFLTGLSHGKLDTMMLMQVGQEYEMFQTVDQPPLTEHIRREVFERMLSLALELGAEGREGKPLGAIFVLGDSTEVLANSKQLIINPFKGYRDEERNILDEAMRETIKGFATLDGAFVIKGTGTIVSAGTYLLPKVMVEEVPQGLGSRHMSAAGITAITRSIAITISESTGTVRLWRQGKLITEIEKAKPVHTSLTTSRADSAPKS